MSMCWSFSKVVKPLNGASKKHAPYDEDIRSTNAKDAKAIRDWRAVGTELSVLCGCKRWHYSVFLVI